MCNTLNIREEAAATPTIMEEEARGGRGGGYMKEGVLKEERPRIWKENENDEEEYWDM